MVMNFASQSWIARIMSDTASKRSWFYLTILCLLQKVHLFGGGGGIGLLYRCSKTLTFPIRWGKKNYHSLKVSGETVGHFVSGVTKVDEPALFLITKFIDLNIAYKEINNNDIANTLAPS